MGSYVARRVLALVPTLFFASVIVFVLVRLIPGDVIDMMLSERVGDSGVSRDQLMRALGLDRPLWQQYLQWVSGVVFHFDLGKSLWQHTSVWQLLAARLPVSLELSLLGTLCGLIIALPIGVYSAVRQNTALDYLARSASLLMLSVPAFWVGTLIMVFPSIWWGWAPPLSYIPFGDDPVQHLRQMLLPALVLGMALSAITMRMTRTMMLEVLRQDYVRTAWAKGLDEPLVLFRHALRNALIPVVTLVGMQVPLLIGGAVIVEQIFVLPGIGSLLVDAVSQRDYPIITGLFLVIGVLVMSINLLVDLSYGLLDPRVRHR